MTDREGVDPRFHPMFQRGYSGAVEPAPVPAARSAGTPPTPEPHARTDGAGDGPFEVTMELAGDPADGLSPSRLNPFIVLLWLVGPTLSVGGAVAAYRVFEETYWGRPGDADPVLQQFLWVLSPSAVTVGLAIIAGLLFWHAAAFRRSRS